MNKLEMPKSLVIDADPVETIEAPASAEDVFKIIAAAAALAAAIAHVVS